MGGSGARLGVRIGDEEPVEEGIYCGGGGGQKTEMFENKRMYLGGLKPIREERGSGWVLWTESPPPQCSNRERNFRENPDAILAVSPPPPAPQLQPCPQGFRKKQSPLDIPCLLQSPRSLSWCRLRSCQSGEGEWGQPGKGLLCRRCAQRSTRQKGALFPPKQDLAWSSYHKGHAKDKEEPGSCGGPEVYRLNPQDEHPPPVETLSTLDPVFVPLAILPANC